MGEKKTSTKDIRTRNWTFILYPESAPENWRNMLDAEHVPWVESPLHEGEMNPDSESEKKPHHHLLLLFSGKKSFEQIKEVTDKLNSTIPQACKNAKGLVRYMAHLDHPDKKQYSPSEIIGHNGADVSSYLRASSAARYDLISEMRKWVSETNCAEFFNLFDYAAETRYEDWFPLLCDNSAYIMGEYIKSRRWGRMEERAEKIVIIDSVTGEVIK